MLSSYSSLFWLINFSMHAYHFLRDYQCFISTKDYILDIITVVMNIMWSLVLIFIATLIIYLISCRHGLNHNLELILSNSKMYIVKLFDVKAQTSICTSIINLPKFMPMTTYRYFIIDENVTSGCINNLINEARKTQRYVCYFSNNMNFDEMFIQIEFINNSQSFIVVFNLSRVCSWEALVEINRLFPFVFKPTNRVYVWGQMDDYVNCKELGIDLFSGSYSKKDLIDMRDNFKWWYNCTFKHNRHCPQLLDYQDIDGPSCSCSYRPYKHQDASWTVVNAIAYTFGQYTDDSNHYNNFQLCLSISSLVHVVNNKWSQQEIDIYRTTCQLKHNVNIFHMFIA
ncbi:unnamed protein product [Adineta steineri]|uniref:Uncharacterized protein n=2 Tax=Adineta steineri TaxID=433720 RepID=A0A819T4I3_9BILA|nr:unnamed protein product [Adineta steineri]